MLLHEFHQACGAMFREINGCEAVAHYGDAAAETACLHQTVGISDLSYRSRLCILGTDRAKFLHGQVTNNVKDLRPGEGCHAAIVSAKGKIQADLRVYALDNEILLEFEPGYSGAVRERLEKYVIAEDVQVVDVSAHYGLWTVQGPKAADFLSVLPWKFPSLPSGEGIVKLDAPALGECYLANQSRMTGPGFDLFVPNDAMPAAAEQFAIAMKTTGARFCGWEALETARIEAGIPRFGADMDENNLAPEVLDTDAISYSKGCYIGQEVIARIRTYGQVAKAMRGLRLPDALKSLPNPGDKLFLGDKEAGHVTSITASAFLKANIALGVVRRECNPIGTELMLQTAQEKISAKVVELPFA